MDPIKEAFQRIKEEMNSLKSEISSLRSELESVKRPQHQTDSPSHSSNNIDKPAEIQTVPQEIKGLRNTLNTFSTGNEGVPTDTSTDQQTDQQTDFLSTIMRKSGSNIGLDDIQETLNTLDNIKKELRLKFKRLTPQEMLIFSTVYGLETKGIEEITYKTLANDLNLSESSIRDYVIKLTSKGIPIVKRRLNNKQITLNIAPNLKKIASLSTIIKLRGL